MQQQQQQLTVHFILIVLKHSLITTFLQVPTARSVLYCTVLYCTLCYSRQPPTHLSCCGSDRNSALKSSIRRFVITEKAPTRAFSWFKAATTTFTLRTLLRHYSKQALTPRSLNVKLGPWRNYHKGRAAIRHYANQPARPFWLLCCGPNFMLRDRGVNAHLA